MKIKDLTPDPLNFNKHSKHGMELLEKSMRKDGFVEAGLISEDNVICSGNARQETAITLGLDDVQIIDIDGTKPIYLRKKGLQSGTQEFKELALQLNAVGKANVVFDAELIEAELGVAVCVEWGIESSVKLEAEEDEFDVPAGGSETDIVLGDLFEIGHHRLLCGSSTEADAVEKLLNGKEPYLMVTDPPYGVEYDASWRDDALSNGKNTGRSKGKVSNDDKADWTEAWALSPSKVAYVYHDPKNSGVVLNSLTDCDFEIRSQIIWYKSHFAISRCDYHPMHEPLWYAVKKGNKGNWASDRKQTTVWEIKKNQKNETGHSTQKPVDCMAKPIANHDGDVYDPFLGSGTTMVASHQLNRKCYGMELDPKYCQVIIDRMIKLDPTLKIKKNGEPYTQTNG